MMLIPICTTALGCFVAFFYADAVYRLLAPAMGHNVLFVSIVAGQVADSVDALPGDEDILCGYCLPQHNGSALDQFGWGCFHF